MESELKSRVMALLAAIPVASWVIDTDGHELFRNAAAGGAPPSLDAVRRVSIDAKTHVLVKVEQRRPRRDLPPRLAQVATALLDGAAEKELPGLLGLSPSSARTYVKRLYARLGVHSRIELARLLQPR